MLKMAGSALLLCGSTFLGCVAARRLNERVKVIRQMIAAVQLIRRELTFSLTPLPNLLVRLEAQAETPLKFFFQRCVGAVKNLERISMKELWRKALQETELPTEREEREIFERLGEVLGRYDSEGQEEFLLYAMEELERCQKAAEAERARLGKVYQVLGVTVGGFLVVLLF